MMRPKEFDAELPTLVRELVNSYKSDPKTHYLDRSHLPSRSEPVGILHLMLRILFPGYHGRQDLTFDNIEYHAGELLTELANKLHEQIYHCLAYGKQLQGKQPAEDETTRQAADKTIRFLRQIPKLRELLSGDTQAAYDGDPAATNTDETLMAYPGLLAVAIYRIAHELHVLNVPLMPRIMTEYAHSVTGIDIHPGATIGRNFFIDHGTGVVIGETTQIGDNVKLYQGVTLGALSFPKDERGRLIRGHKRHPTIKDNVTIYANATILGGDTVIGENCTIGGNVFLTSSVAPGCTVSLKKPELRFRNRPQSEQQIQGAVSDEPDG